MNSLILGLNSWGERFLAFVGPMLWQSSLLIVVLFGSDLMLRQKVPPAARYALWLALLVKLVLPPSFAAPTSLAWWVRPSPAPPPPHAPNVAAPRRSVSNAGRAAFQRVADAYGGTSFADVLDGLAGLLLTLTAIVMYCRPSFPRYVIGDPLTRFGMRTAPISLPVCLSYTAWICFDSGVREQAVRSAPAPSRKSHVVRCRCVRTRNSPLSTRCRPRRARPLEAAPIRPPRCRRRRRW